MRMLAAALGAATAIVLLSGCAYDRYDRYSYGYGNGYYGTQYGGYYDRYDRNCWSDRYGNRRCERR